MAKTKKKNGERIRDLMTEQPIVLDASASVMEAARAMRDADVGDVLVQEDGKLCGIVTDRDLVIRCLAEPEGSAKTLGDVCSEEIITLAADAEVDDAIELMRENAVRRIPIVDGDEPVGIVSLGDLALARDRRSCLGEISAAPPDR